jgi:hypothetical protein
MSRGGCGGGGRTSRRSVHERLLPSWPLGSITLARSTADLTLRLVVEGEARQGLQQLIELEVAAVIGAIRHERTEQRLGYRNGYRSRSLTTQVGDIDLLIPKLRAGSFLPSFLEPRRRVDPPRSGKMTPLPPIRRPSSRSNDSLAYLAYIVSKPMRFWRQCQLISFAWP